MNVLISTVDADGRLVLQHQGISSHRADYAPVRLPLFRVKYVPAKEDMNPIMRDTCYLRVLENSQFCIRYSKWHDKMTFRAAFIRIVVYSLGHYIVKFADEFS